MANGFIIVSLIYHATGIVLSSRGHREADRWFSIFTREFGKIETVGRGAFKPLAKLSPHLEMPAILELMVVRGRQYDIVASVERIKSFPVLQERFSGLVLAQSALHLVDIGSRPHEADPILYEELVAWLSFLNQSPAFSPERAGFLLGSFALKLLALIGYRPELSRCLSCKKQIEAGKYLWHALRGGVVCETCVAKDQEQWFSAKGLPDDVLKLMRFGLSESFEAQTRPHLSGESLLGFHEAVESLMISHFPTIPANSLRAACSVC